MLVVRLLGREVFAVGRAEVAETPEQLGCADLGTAHVIAGVDPGEDVALSQRIGF